MPLNIERNDITRVDARAYVLPANEGLVLGGGVAGAIAAAAGREDLQAACDALGGCPTGNAVVTSGFGCRADFIVHAVGPVWSADPAVWDWQAARLRSAYDAALAAAADAGAESVAVPLISAGIFGCPATVSFRIALEACRAFLAADDMDITLVLFGSDAVSAARTEQFADIAAYIDDEYAAVVKEQDRWARPEWGGREEGSEERSAFGRSPRFAPRRKSARRARRAEDADVCFDMRTLGEVEADTAPAAEPDIAQAAESDECVYAAPAMLGAAPNMAGGAAAAMPAPKRSPMPEAASQYVSVPAEYAAAAPASPASAPATLSDLLNSLDEPFSTTLLALIDTKGLTDAQVYKRANLSRQHFSKIRSDATYRPTKKTVLALAVALELDLAETNDLLARAGFALSGSSKADLIVRYFIERGQYDIFAINEALYAFDQPLLV